MKLSISVMVGLIAGTLAGCGQSTGVATGVSDEGLSVEAVAVRKVFASAPGTLKYPVEDALRLIQADSANPTVTAEVVPQLQKLAAAPAISPEQQKALEALLNQLRAKAPGSNSR